MSRRGFIAIFVPLLTNPGFCRQHLILLTYCQYTDILIDDRMSISCEDVSQVARIARMTPDHRRMEILSAARVLFLEYGLESVSMGQIAEAAEVSRPTVYRYFSSPMAIWEALFEDELTQFWEQCQPLVAGPKPTGGILRAVLGLITAQPTFLALLHSGGSRAFQLRRRQIVAERLVPLLAQYSPPSRVGPDDSTILLTVLEGTAWWCVVAAPPDPEAFLDHVVAWIHAAWPAESSAKELS